MHPCHQPRTAAGQRAAHRSLRCRLLRRLRSARHAAAAARTTAAGYERRGEPDALTSDSTTSSDGRTCAGRSRRTDRTPGWRPSLLTLERHGSATLELRVACRAGEDARAPAVQRFGDVLAESRRMVRADAGDRCAITSSNETFNRWLQRSAADLRMMVTETRSGRIPTRASRGSARRSAATG